VPPSCLTVLAPIRRGEDAALRAVLRAIGDDIRGARREAGASRPHIDFPASERIHFARFGILADPDRGPGAMRLLFASVYDGALDDHLSELLAITSDPDAVWGRCEGYGGVAGFATFIRTHAHQPVAFYIAFRDETSASIRRAFQSGSDMPPLPPPSLIARLANLLATIARAAPLPIDMVRAVARFGIGTVYRGVSRIIASLDRVSFFRVFNRLTGNRLPPRQSPYSSAAVDHCQAPAPLVPGDEIPTTAPATPPSFREDVVVQNQLTLVTVITPANDRRVRAVMSGIDAYAKRLAPPGSLLGISTIHFVRWFVVDEGRRLIMVSDYDGSWENYIDEFAEMILSGLDAIWETAFGYPPDGARDLPAFKRFLRLHQVPSELFFSAYPNTTVQNIAAAAPHRRTRVA
jgi:hypothetical protein